SILQWIADLASSIVTDAEDVADIASRIANAPDLDASAFCFEVLALTRVVAESADATSDFDLIGAALQVDASTLPIMKILQAM
ncbi:hypothetical protein, partial [Agrobacterium rosae]|uniref:hypothetical protein n=1 Tax=Agrobacterium rosae TaxID=1972867 RepID=UPI003B9E1F2F